MSYNILEEREKGRLSVINRLISLFPEDDERHILVLKYLADGENFTDFLRMMTYISPMEMRNLSEIKMGESIKDGINAIQKIKDFFDMKEKLFYLFNDYVYYFIGSLNPYHANMPVEIGGSNSLVDEKGLIDYTPYLEKLGIDIKKDAQLLRVK